ncbi:hypothetical protein DTU56_09620 [Salmonella enterica subsp. enterica serovar Muenchen]|uniref:Uncharacterized protein n=1 Tax=Salmonella muenchen TaxID=596 RepID=A0A5U8XQF6_SALMU|nr:hypothetical protein [Salmonella enterica subsp. enterica serovar Muenchen]
MVVKVAIVGGMPLRLRALSIQALLLAGVQIASEQEVEQDRKSRQPFTDTSILPLCKSLFSSPWNGKFPQHPPHELHPKQFHTLTLPRHSRSMRRPKRRK